MKRRLSVMIDEGVLEAAKACVAGMSARQAHRMTLSSLVERALDDTAVGLAVDAGLDEWPERTAPLPRGPVRGRPNARDEPGMCNTYRAAERLGVSASTVRKLVARGVLPHTRIGRLLRFREQTLAEFIAAQTSNRWVPQIAA